MYSLDTTITAIATAPGMGAIAIVRISGKDAFSILEKIFSKSLKTAASHTAHYGKILDEQKLPIDTCLVLIMKNPHSYTGEDSIEIHCHGGPFVTRKVLERVVQAGATLAKPGEFTFRAFQNKKIDLAQAEAVQEVIGAKNHMALVAAKNQLEGRLSQKISGFQKELTSVSAILEAWVDFPEEDLAFMSFEELSFSLQTTLEEMKKLLSTFHEGKMLFEGCHLCIVGTPNVGKSSLMNALLGKERAIVTPIAGTTRDLIEEPLELGSLHLHLVDTAGIRKTNEEIEKEGIKRSQKALEDADFILLVLDASKKLSEEDLFLLDSCPDNKTLLVWNKTDLLCVPQKTCSNKQSVSISVKNQQGLEDLRQKILHMIENKSFSKEEVLIAKMRHKEALLHAIEYCQQVLVGIQEKKVSPEFLSFDLRSALHELGTIIGTNVTEDILSEIFSKFCVGK